MNKYVKRILDNPDLRRQVVAACEKAGTPLSHEAVHDWKNLKRGVPASRVLIVSKILGVPPHELRPDIFSNDR
jgi:hypothetical protein